MIKRSHKYTTMLLTSIAVFFGLFQNFSRHSYYELEKQDYDRLETVLPQQDHLLTVKTLNNVFADASFVAIKNSTYASGTMDISGNWLVSSDYVHSDWLFFNHRGAVYFSDNSNIVNVLTFKTSARSGLSIVSTLDKKLYAVNISWNESYHASFTDFTLIDSDVNPYTLVRAREDNYGTFSSSNPTNSKLGPSIVFYAKTNNSIYSLNGAYSDYSQMKISTINLNPVSRWSVSSVIRNPNVIYSFFDKSSSTYKPRVCGVGADKQLACTGITSYTLKYSVAPYGDAGTVYTDYSVTGFANTVIIEAVDICGFNMGNAISCSGASYQLHNLGTTGSTGGIGFMSEYKFYSKPVSSLNGYPNTAFTIETDRVAIRLREMAINILGRDPSMTLQQARDLWASQLTTKSFAQLEDEFRGSEESISFEVRKKVILLVNSILLDD